MDELVLMGKVRELLCFCIKKLRNSKKFGIQIPINPSGEYFVTEHADGSRNQFYFDRLGNFMARRSQGSGGLPRLLVRAIGNKFRLKTARFVSKDDQKLEIYLKYELR